ncbi:heterodisulfide reductase-related iron-sulfur binding cluster [Desulfonatronovibrio magnus]|uniref:heterodisulfide reductase-related iron-sulfur binding cluster n=1 Tax=Desulfonatronovibrio magnus TaxID=698827 RepID=UPI0005EBAE06|nr:heterodisulfide reductase-related iron-sulfur binding cluster [Desulfonatronovibrio magnus]
MNKSPEKLSREVLDQCADCDQCRDTMRDVCPFFAELYDLYDQEQQTKVQVSSAKLRYLTDQCNFCGLCPCLDIRVKTLQAKSSFVSRDGMPAFIKILQDVESLAAYLSRTPRWGNSLLQNKAASFLLKKIAGIHTHRSLPEIPVSKFSTWARDNGICNNNDHIEPDQLRVAYFAGCNARHFFPEVAKAVVHFLKRNNVDVFYPPQKCCSMPTLLEGDEPLSIEFAGYNLDSLYDAVKSRRDLIFSCPTCGYLFKKLLSHKAYYSSDYQQEAGAEDGPYVLHPVEHDYATPRLRKHHRLHKSMYANILKDDGPFSSLPALKRIRISESSRDLGQYLTELLDAGRLSTDFVKMPVKVAYFPPCHVREQGAGMPYVKLLKLIPGIELKVLDDPYFCCGMAGIMGYKKDYHHKSLEMADPLFRSIKEIAPDILCTDCLSCRLQFSHALPYQQAHPLELMQY